MNQLISRRPARLLAALVLPGVATFVAWWLFLGFDTNDVYSVPQCAGLVVVLVAIGAAATWWSHSRERSAVVVSAGAGISAGCFTSWMDDDTGLFLVGWMMLTPVAFLVTWLVVELAATARARHLDDERWPSR